MTIQTVLGPIDAARMGQTLVHEHISCADWSMRSCFGEKFFDRRTVLRLAKRCFAPLKARGVRTVVDGTPINLGRDLSLLRMTAQETGLQIIASSGFYYQEEPWLQARAEEEIFALLDADAQNAGVMKCAVEEAGVTPLMAKLLRCTGAAARKHGLPVFCHTAAKQETGLPAFEVLSNYVNPSRIVLGHTGDSEDRDYLLRAAQTGCYLGFDRLGYCDRGVSARDAVSNILWLCERGFEDRILLSHDAAVYLAFWDSWEKSKNTVTDFCVVHDRVLPLLRAGGFTDDDVKRLLEDNPRRLFEGE